MRQAGSSSIPVRKMSRVPRFRRCQIVIGAFLSLLGVQLQHLACCRCGIASTVCPNALRWVGAECAATDTASSEWLRSEEQPGVVERLNERWSHRKSQAADRRPRVQWRKIVAGTLALSFCAALVVLARIAHPLRTIAASQTPTTQSPTGSPARRRAASWRIVQQHDRRDTYRLLEGARRFRRDSRFLRTRYTSLDPLRRSRSRSDPTA